MEQKVLDYIEEKQLFRDIRRIGVAVSGGVDSCVLLHFMCKYARHFELEVIVVHMNHQLRIEAKDDEEFVQLQASKYGVHCISKSLNIGAIAQQVKQNVQDVARNARYNFFNDVAKEKKLDAILTAHHGVDQIETQLFRYMRGTTTAGLIGIRPRLLRDNTYMLIRPFLCVKKTELYAYADTEDIPFREDASNQKLYYTRNHIRKHLIPHIMDYNPRSIEHSLQLGEQIERDENFLQEMTNHYLQSVTTDEGKIQIEMWKALHPSMQYRTLRTYSEQMMNGQNVSNYQLGEMYRMLHQPIPQLQFSLNEPAVFKKRFDQCYIESNYCEKSPYIVYIQREGRYLLPNEKTIVVQKWYDEDVAANQWVMPSTELMLTVRSFEPGDKVRIRGLGGHKKVKKLFLEHKIPQELRCQWPVILNEENEIIWVPGLMKCSSKEQSKTNMWLLSYI
ncbi:MAG: tRNA lysidine(34) synthetase TilS [Bacilli bacterium]